MPDTSSNSNSHSSANTDNISNNISNNIANNISKGTVKWFNNSKGYGFIEIEATSKLSELFNNLNEPNISEQDKNLSKNSENTVLNSSRSESNSELKTSTSKLEVFAHFSQIVMNGYRTLKPGEPVVFEINEGPKGLNAKNIQPIIHIDIP